MRKSWARLSPATFDSINALSHPGRSKALPPTSQLISEVGL